MTDTIKASEVNHITGRRWFDRVNGNTYHNTVLHLKDGTTVESGFQYGYNEQYLQTAFAMMGEEYTGTRGLRENLEIAYSVSDVARKRDL